MCASTDNSSKRQEFCKNGKNTFEKRQAIQNRIHSDALVMIGEAAMEIVIPFLMKFLIDEIYVMEQSGQFSMNIVWYGLAMLACAAFALFCGIMGGRLASKASAGFAANLRYDMYDNIQTYSFANIDNFSTASLITESPPT